MRISGILFGSSSSTRYTHTHTSSGLIWNSPCPSFNESFVVIESGTRQGLHLAEKEGGNGKSTYYVQRESNGMNETKKSLTEYSEKVL